MSFNKMNAILDRAMSRLEQLEAQGVDITKLADPKKTAANRAKQAKKNAAFDAAKAARLTAETGFVIGQTVRTKRNDRGAIAPLFGVVIAIGNGAITLDNGRAFAASSLTAA